MKGRSTVKLNKECAVVRNSGNANPVTAEESVNALRCCRLAVQAVLELRTCLHSDKLVSQGAKACNAKVKQMVLSPYFPRRNLLSMFIVIFRTR